MLWARQPQGALSTSRPKPATRQGWPYHCPRDCLENHRDHLLPDRRPLEAGNGPLPSLSESSQEVALGSNFSQQPPVVHTVHKHREFQARELQSPWRLWVTEAQRASKGNAMAEQGPGAGDPPPHTAPYITHIYPPVPAWPVEQSSLCPHRLLPPLPLGLSHLRLPIGLL